MTIEEALKEGILEKRIVYLRLIPKPSALVKDPNHVAYGGFDGSITSLTIGVDKHNRLINPFKTDKEKEFFEFITKHNLSVYTPNNEYWSNYSFNVIKDPNLVKIGLRFDLSDPNQMLDYKVIMTNTNLVAPSFEKMADNPFYRYVFIDENHEEKNASAKMDELERIYEFYGEIKNSVAKMRSFLNVYYATKMKSNEVPSGVDKEFLHKEIKKIIEIDRQGYMQIIDDKDYETKVFIGKGLDAGAITKEGIGTYRIVGEDKDFGYTELVAFIEMLEANKEVLYGKLEAIIKKNSK